MNKTILVTGAAGHIGNNLCRRLAAENNYNVRCFVRENSDLSSLAGLDVEKIYGDVTDYDSFLSAARGCDSIFHLAAVYSHNPNLKSQILETSIKGTENFIRIVKEIGVEKAIYASSAAAIGVSDSPVMLLDENCYVTGECEAYAKAKLDSQLMVEDAIKKDNLPVIIVFPTTVIGENDYKITPSNHMILRFIKEPNVVYIDGGINVVYITDVVEGIFQSYLKGKAGEKFLFAGNNVTIYELMSSIAELTGRKKPFIKLGKEIIFPLAAFFDVLVRITNKPAPISKMQAKTRVGKFGFYSIEKARRELGYSPMNLDNSLVKTIEWFKKRNLI
jgi:dihydroflavonol-4-reductase